MLQQGLALAGANTCGANTWLRNEPLYDETEDGILTADRLCYHLVRQDWVKY